MKNVVFWDVTTCGSCRNRQLKERIASMIGLRLLVTANVVPISPILVTVIMETVCLTKRRLLQEPHEVTSQKTAFFNGKAVRVCLVS
jgi:hypothetical protein